MRPEAGARGDLVTRIFVVNFDGTGQIGVDSYPLSGTARMLDISADGSKVVSSSSFEVRIANGDGSGALSLIALSDGWISAIAISGDGTKVFFRLERDVFIRGSDPPIPVQRGIWVINADGSGRRQVVSPAQMEALGIPPPVFFGGGNNVQPLASSTDGSQIVFVALNDPQSGGFGQGLFGVNLDSTGLHDFLGRVFVVTHSGITSDGTKVFYDVLVASSPFNNEIGVVNFDGTGRLPLIDSRTLPRAFPSSDDRAQISTDGSLLLLGSRGLLLNTDGSGMLQQLAIGTPGSVFLGALLYNELSRATMNGSATRFFYFALPFAQPRQLATLEINPDSLGDAPSITGPTIDPPFVLTRGRSTATVSASVSAGNPLDTVGNTVLLNGLDDPNVVHEVMTDRGGGLFASDRVFAGNDAVVGPRTVRVQAGVRAGDDKLHATAVEFAPFAVLEDPPEASPRGNR